MQLVLGMGCDRGASQQTLETAIDQALAIIGASRSGITALATIDKKSDEVALLALSSQHGWPLSFFTAEQLVQIEVPNPSEVVHRYMGTPAVAEAAAMLAGHCGMEKLILEKHKYRGDDNKNATVSIVRLDNE